MSAQRQAARGRAEKTGISGMPGNTEARAGPHGGGSYRICPGIAYQGKSPAPVDSRREAAHALTAARSGADQSGGRGMKQVAQEGEEGAGSEYPRPVSRPQRIARPLI